MAKECSESSVATSSSTPQNWWDLHHASSALSSWNDTTSTNPWQAHQNPNSNSSCEEEVSMSTTSFTYASNHSGLTVESSQRFLDQPSASSNELIGEHAPDTQLWNHVLLNVGGNGELQNSSSNNVGENLLDHALSSRSIYEPAFDYLKKMDNNWEFTNSNTSFNNINGFGHGSLTTTTTATATPTHGNERLNKLSNLVSHWSIAPPHTTLLDPQTGNISLNDHDHQFSHQATATIRNNSGFLSYYARDLKPENEHHHHHASMFRHGSGGLINGSTTVEAGHENNNNYYYEMFHSPRASSARNLADSMTLSSRLTKPLIDVQVPKPYFKPLNLSDSKKHGIRNSSLMTGRERGTTNEGKKKRSEETTDQSVPKKPKNESSTASSSVKLQVPKVKLADKITALQQIVSPFGKTDTASVLYEAIGYIKFLQEQVQLLSNPYMKSNSHKDTWGGLERKEKGDIKVDLRSRGLCLVPISCTPKVYHENTGSDYWTPAYRGCLYR